MMTVAPVASAADAAGYYSSKDNYYFLEDMTTQWMGEGARELGLEGPVDLDMFTAILHGDLPNGVELGKEVHGSHVHRPGHDFTFSAPKSISMLILAGGDKRLLEAHHESVQETLAIMEQTVSARDTKDGITRIVPTGKMVAALFTHDTTRNLDPGVHTHAVVANVTELDGKWKALATDYIHGAGFIETVYRNQITYGKIYRNLMKEKTEAIGYETELTGGKHELWEVKGFPEAVLEEFSSRHREIQTRAGEDASLRSRDVAALDTRQRKQDISRYGEERVQQAGGKERQDQGEREYEQISQSKPEGRAVQQELEHDKDAPIAKPETEDGRSRLRERWQSQMDSIGFDINSVMDEAREREAKQSSSGEEKSATVEAMDAVRTAISILSDNKTRFTYGDLLLTAHNAGEMQNDIPTLRLALDQAISDNLLIPLDGDKGVFTSHIHLLDELSVQSLAAEILKENKVVNFSLFAKSPPEHREAVANAPIAILSTPASIERLRETTEELVNMSRGQGREVKVLASSVERAISLAKSPYLKNEILHRSRMLDGSFALMPQSTLIIEGAEKLGLKEMLVLTGEAREKNAQLLFLDSAGRQSNASALSVLTAAGVERHGINGPEQGLEARVISIQDKRDRYQALAERYADLSSPDNTVTAVVTGAREQQHLTGVIRDALQNAGKLGRETFTVDTRAPLYITAKARKLPETYRPGMVLEDRTEKNETQHYVIDRVHEDTRMLSLIDRDGVLSRVKLSALTGDWRLYTQSKLSIALGDKLFALAADKEAGLKARDRLTVISVEDGALIIAREGQKKPVRLDTSNPLYVTHGYVSSPGSRDNERGTVLASLGARDLSVNIMNALAQSGHEAEIFTGEALSRAEEKLGRMRTTRSPLSLVRQASGKEETSEAIDSLNKNLLSDVQKAVTRSVAQMRQVTFSEAKLLEEALTFTDGVAALQTEISRQVKEGDLIKVVVDNEPRFVARATWEMEKAIVSEIESGKNTQIPLMSHIDPTLLKGLTQGQIDATMLILQSPDRFTGVQGYAGVGKTTQFNAVKAAVDTLPENIRPVIVGLGPTHRSVKEMAGTGIDAQTLKSFVMDWQMRTSAGEDVRYDNMLFLIDESSMIGNQDTAAAYRAIAAGNGRAVPVGDVAQLQSPESGAPFQLMQERSPIDVAVMKEIVRQRNVDLKSAVYSVISNDVTSALQSIEKVSPEVVPRRPGAVLPSGSIVQSKDPVSNIVADYMSRTDAARDQTMILVQLHDDRKAINEGIHEALAAAKELGSQAVHIPILDRINGGRHDFNRLKDWKPGQVVLANERYLNVISTDSKNGNITLRDEAGRTHFYSPKELNSTEIEVFEYREIELRAGDSVRLSKTQKQAGHAAHEQYRVETLRDNGEIVLRNSSGDKVIDPKSILADRHVDYAWAVTGYGGQGASALYSLVLEGIDGARKRMSGMRAFYINVSRAKDHVQIVTDDKSGWVNTLTPKNDGPATAHDALVPEPERDQARRIWSMGQSASKTAIGRAFLKTQGLKARAVTARIIPPTRKFPDAHLALPIYDGNGKAAGLTMVPLKPETGDFQMGDERRIMTAGAQAALLQKSLNGETHVVDTIVDAIRVAREHPGSGILMKTGEQELSPQLLKISGGHLPVDATTVREAIKADELAIVVPDADAETANTSGNRDDVVAREEKLAGSLADIVVREKAVPDPDAAARASVVKEDVSITEQALLKEKSAEPAADIRPHEQQKLQKTKINSDRQLAVDINSATLGEQQLVGEARAALHRGEQERKPPELTQERNLNIQKER